MQVTLESFTIPEFMGGTQSSSDAHLSADEDSADPRFRFQGGGVLPTMAVLHCENWL